MKWNGGSGAPVDAVAAAVAAAVPDAADVQASCEAAIAGADVSTGAEVGAVGTAVDGASTMIGALNDVSQAQVQAAAEAAVTACVSAGTLPDPAEVQSRAAAAVAAAWDDVLHASVTDVSAGTQAQVVAAPAAGQAYEVVGFMVNVWDDNGPVSFTWDSGDFSVALTLYAGQVASCTSPRFPLFTVATGEALYVDKASTAKIHAHVWYRVVTP